MLILPQADNLIDLPHQCRQDAVPESPAQRGRATRPPISFFRSGSYRGMNAMLRDSASLADLKLRSRSISRQKLSAKYDLLLQL